MQFGIFTVSDITEDPTTGRTPSEAEKIRDTITIAKHAEEVGLDVFALGEHHNPPFWSSSPTTTLALHRRADRAPAALHRDDADHDERPGEDRRGLRDAAARLGRPHRPHARPRQHRPGLPVVRQGHPPGPAARDRELQPAAPAVARGRRRLGGQVPHARCRASPPRRARSTTCRRSSGTARSARPRSPSRPPTTATDSSRTTSSGRRSTTSGSSRCTASASRTTATARPSRRSSGLGGQVFMRAELAGRRARVPPVLRQRARLRARPVDRGLHRDDAAHRRLAAAGHRPVRRHARAVTATTSASCS